MKRKEYNYKGRLSRVAQTYILDYKESDGNPNMKKTLKRMWKCYFDTPKCLCPNNCLIHE